VPFAAGGARRLVTARSGGAMRPRRGGAERVRPRGGGRARVRPRRVDALGVRPRGGASARRQGGGDGDAGEQGRKRNARRRQGALGCRSKGAHRRTSGIEVGSPQGGEPLGESFDRRGATAAVPPAEGSAPRTRDSLASYEAWARRSQASDAREPTRPHSRLPPRGTSVVWRRRLARLMQSPLTDSNRRAPPYRGGGRRRHRRTSLVDWVCVWLAASVLAAVDLLLTQTAADDVEVGVGRILPRFLSARCRGDLGIPLCPRCSRLLASHGPNRT